MLDRAVSQAIQVLRNELDALKNKVSLLRGSPSVSTAQGGALNFRTLQIGFEVQLTSSYDTTGGTGYSWERLQLVPIAGTGNPFISSGIQSSGTSAFAANGDQGLPSGTMGWLEPSPAATGYIFTTGVTAPFNAVLIAEQDGFWSWKRQFIQGNTTIDGPDLSPYNAVPTYQYSATDKGNPQPGDMVVMQFGPLASGSGGSGSGNQAQYQFIPHPSLSAQCNGLSFLIPLALTQVGCVTATVISSSGRCFCVTQGQSIQLCRSPGFAGAQGYYGGQFTTCCGCATLQLNVTIGGGAFNIAAILTVTNACDGSGQYTYDLIPVGSGCKNGKGTLLLAGGGPLNCNEPNSTLDGCADEFVIEIECIGIPPTTCECLACCNQAAPLAFTVYFSSPWMGITYFFIGWSGSGSPCTWSSDCSGGSGGSGSGSGGGGINATLTLIPGLPSKWQLIINGATYASPGGEGNTLCGDGLYTLVSGPVGAPGTVQVTGNFGGGGEINCYNVASNLIAVVSASTVPGWTAISPIALTSGIPGPPGGWASENLAPCPIDTNTIGVNCNGDGTYTVALSYQCPGDPAPRYYSQVATVIQTTPNLILQVVNFSTGCYCPGTMTLTITSS